MFEFQQPHIDLLRKVGWTLQHPRFKPKKHLREGIC